MIVINVQVGDCQLEEAAWFGEGGWHGGYSNRGNGYDFVQRSNC